MLEDVLARCQEALPGWAGLSLDDVNFDAPKGFSSYTISARPRRAVSPPAAFYRRLEGKENAILDPATERAVFLLLGEHHIAAECYRYTEDYRIEAFYRGRTLRPADLADPEVLHRIAGELWRLHQLRPEGLPAEGFFTLLHRRWGPLARQVVEEQRDRLPPDERAISASLAEIYSDEMHQRVLDCLPGSPLAFCHNDTYHGNIMRLEGGEIRLLDFEFSCLGHPAFDFANLFAETVMVHGLPEPPHFRIDEPAYGDRELLLLIDAYLDHAAAAGRTAERARLLEETRQMIRLSDYMYAMAAIPLSVEPIQQIRFIPYARQRLDRFLGG